MKIKFLSILIPLAMLQSCKENTAQKPQEHTQSEGINPNECYMAIYEKDTLHLGLITANPDTITGTMVMKLDGMPIKTGIIAGEFHGDTLLVSYTFTQGANKRVVFKNPLALLKKGNQLILGNGEIATTLGASYFVKGKPIDFERVKYKFAAGDCGEVNQSKDYMLLQK